MKKTEEITETASEPVNLNRLWRKSGPKGKRLPFKEFIKPFNKKNEDFRNMIAPAPMYAPGESDGMAPLIMVQTSGGSAYYPDQGTNNLPGSDVVTPYMPDSYTPIKETDTNFYLPDNIGITDKTTTATETPDGVQTMAPSTNNATAGTTTGKMPKDPSLMLFFLLGSAIGVATVIVYNKYKN